jgi:Ser/Thr protein kinase RdoA (MazF antagonist)
MENSTDSAFLDAVALESGLLTSLPRLPDSIVLELLHKHYGLKGELVRIPTEKDETFRLQDDEENYLVKVTSPDENPETVRFQTACMAHLEQIAPQLPVQRIVPDCDGDLQVLITTSDGSFDRVLRVMRFMPGVLLANQAATDGQLHLVGSRLADLGFALQDFDHPHADRLLLWDLKHFHRMRPLLEYVGDKQKRALAERIFNQFDTTVVPFLDSFTTQVIHGDFSPFNVLVDPLHPGYVTGIIDFGDAVRTPVIFDISVTMANLLGMDPDRPWDQALHVLNGFLSVRPLSTRELDALVVAAQARLLLRALITQWRANQLPQRREYLLSHSKSDWDCLFSTAAAPTPVLRTKP